MPTFEAVRIDAIGLNALFANVPTVSRPANSGYALAISSCDLRPRQNKGVRS